MGRLFAVLRKLVKGLLPQSGIALNDQLRNLLVALPRGILHQMPALFFCQLFGIGDGIVIIHIGHGALLRADPLYGGDTGGSRALGHKNI